MTVEDLDMIVPHQANERIIEAIRKSIKFPTEKVFYYIREYGNTSSNTIPLSLEALMQRQKTGDRVGMTAFGGGFTFAAGMLEVL
jgi:3-oxoacyl-[acyl-carrier-protein] synthase III